MSRVAVKSELLRWAVTRSNVPKASLARRFDKLSAWEAGTVQPTLKQLEAFARAVHVPIGFLFLDTPPRESVPIPDFRTIADAHVAQPSPDLLETIYICEQRQEWYRDFTRTNAEAPLPYVGSLSTATDVRTAAATIRQTLNFDVEHRSTLSTWSDALRGFVAQADEAGILVMCSGIVGSNTHRKLDPQEFRGFALPDVFAPVVFVNGADTRSAQIFTLAHELAHVWLGQPALSNADARDVPTQRVERWCNEVAAELLVPLDRMRELYRSEAGPQAETDRLARAFKVSTLVILRRMHDAGGLTRAQFWTAYDAELERLRQLPQGSGGNFYLTLPARVSKRFARALVASTLEGHTLYRDALRMLGFSKLKTFDEIGHQLGVIS